MEKKEGLRYSKGKLRYDLLHAKAQEGLVKVVTWGATKYEPRNWEKGMKWTENIIGPMKRHIAAIEAGEDFDYDKNCPDCQISTKEKWVCVNHSGQLHIDHVQANAHFLSAFYTIFPQGDDRNHLYLNRPKIGLDIDEVLCDWAGAWNKKRGIDTKPNSWHFDRNLMDEFKKMEEEGTLDAFYMDLKPLIDPNDLPFEPDCYITSRPVSTELTESWLDAHDFPTKPVFTTGLNKSKVQIALEQGLEIFVDDAYHNFVELNKAGICCYLYDTPHNRKYDVGFKRIYSLDEVFNKK